MKKKFFLLIMLGAFVFSSEAQTIPWTEDYESYSDNTGLGSLGYSVWEGSAPVSDITVDGGVAHSGNKFVAALRNATINKTLYARKSLTLVEGKSYIFSAWVKSPDAFGISTGVKLGTAGDVGGGNASTSTSWNKLSQTFTVGSGQTSVVVYVSMYSYATAKQMHFDDMSVVEANNISVTRNNNSFGTVSGDGINATGLSASLIATPESGYHFVNWTESGTPVSTNTTYTFTVSADRTLVANFEPNTVPISSGTTNASDITCTTCDVTVATGAELNIDVTKTLKSISVAAGGKLTLNSSSALTATNGITLTNSASGTASFVDSRTADNPTAIAGTISQAITETDRNWYVSAPVSGLTDANITLTGAKIVQRNEALSKWDDVTGSLVAGVGYIAVASANTGTTSWSLSGNLNSGKVEVALTNSGTSATGYNLVGNPYPSYLNWEQVLNLNATNASLVQPTVWFRTAVWNIGTSKYDYSFPTYNSAGRVAVPTSTSGYLPPLQAFWVRANNAGTLTFTNAMRSHGNGSTNIMKAKSATNETQQLVRIQLKDMASNRTDEAVIYTNTNALNGFDNYDSQKMSSSPELEIYSKADNEKLVINGLMELSDNLEIPLGYTSSQAGDFHLIASELSNFNTTKKIYLRDKVANTETELLPTIEYTFNSGITANNESRFSLLFKAPGATTGTQNPENEKVSVFVNSQNEIVILAPESTVCSVYNAVGQKLLDKQITTNKTTISNQLKSGVYFVTVRNGMINKTQKVILN